MSEESSPTTIARREYQKLCKDLSNTGFISQGSVQNRTSRKGGGGGYQWTRKVAQKTITVSLSAEQFKRMQAAVNNYRRLHNQLKRMEKLSRKSIFQEVPHPRRRKPRGLDQQKEPDAPIGILGAPILIAVTNAKRMVQQALRHAPSLPTTALSRQELFG